MRLPSGPDQSPTNLFNPLEDDFTVQRADDSNAPQQYTVPSFSIRTFPKYLADHIAGKLAHEVVMRRGVKTNYDTDLKEVLKEILV